MKHAGGITIDRAKREHQSSKQAHFNGSATFWRIHAEYWDERGYHSRAEECRTEERKARFYG
jgi:hypothetical protein